MAKTIKELEDSIETKEKAATEKGGGQEEIYKAFRDSLTPEEFDHHRLLEKLNAKKIPTKYSERIAQKNKDNYYNNIAYISDVMGLVRFVLIVTIIMWVLSAVGIFIVFAQ